LQRKPNGLPSALKHGAFSRVRLLPWENEEEYNELHRDLREEWQPDGALEEDAVFTIMTAIWRKRRVQDKRQFETQAALQQNDFKILTEMPRPLFDTQHEAIIDALSHQPKDRNPVRDEVSQLLGLSASLYGHLEGELLKLMIEMSGPEISQHLNVAAPREKFSTPPEWVAAVKREIDNVMLPRARKDLESPYSLAAKSAQFLTTDVILEDLALEERLDAVIDRATRRLAQSKMLKSVSNLNRDRVFERLPERRVVKEIESKVVVVRKAPTKAKKSDRVRRKARK